MLLSSSQRRTSMEPSKLPSDVSSPLMDLSSLEGPPMVDSTFFVSPDTPNPRIQSNPHSATHVWPPKPPASTPTSIKVTSPQQHQNRRPDWPSDSKIINRTPRQQSTHSGRTHVLDELSPDCGPRYVRELPSFTQPSQPPGQSKRYLPLTWLEDEKKWVVGETFPPNTRESRNQHDVSPSRSPISPVSPMSPCHDIIQRLDEYIAYNDRLEREGLLDQAAAYGSHGFTSAHGTALNDRVARWIAITQGMHQEQEWV